MQKKIHSAGFHHHRHSKTKVFVSIYYMSDTMLSIRMKDKWGILLYALRDLNFK